MYALLDVRFRQMARSPALAECADAELRRLERLHPLHSCHVTVEQPHGHARHPAVQITVEVRGAGFDLAVREDTRAVGADAYELLAHLFKLLRRQLETRAGRLASASAP